MVDTTSTTPPEATAEASESRLFESRASGYCCLALVVVIAIAPAFLNHYWLSLLIQIGYLSIAAMGLNILVGYSGQISLGHGAFFGFGAFASAWLHSTTALPVFFCIPLAGLMTTAVGMIFGIPAARLKGLYLAIATLAAQYILEDFFVRATWFTGGASGSMASPVSLFGFQLDNDQRYIYLVLFYVVLMYVLAANFLRTRDGRALVAVRDHYLSAEIMGIPLTRYRILAFGISSFYAGIAGALFGHYLGFVSIEGFTILMSIQFLAMIIIGGLGTIRGSIYGTVFIIVLPEIMHVIAVWVGSFAGGGIAVTQAMPFIKEISIGLVIILFLMYEPEGLAHRWQLVKTRLGLTASAATSHT